MERDRRWKNPETLEDYIGPLSEGRAPQREEEKISFGDQAFETVMLALRTSEGVDPAVYGSLYGKDAENALLSGAADLEAKGLADRSGGRIRLTDAGMDLQNTLLVEFWEALDRVT